jgi:hypothetical protein
MQRTGLEGQWPLSRGLIDFVKIFADVLGDLTTASIYRYSELETSHLIDRACQDMHVDQARASASRLN